MTSWRNNSILADFVERHVQSQDRDPLFMPPQMGGGMGGMLAPMLPEDDQSLQEGISALHYLAPCLQSDSTLASFVQELISNATEIEQCSRTMRDEQLFDKLQPMRMRLMWVPIHLVQAMKHADSNFLAVAHLYAIAMAIDASLPELKGAAFGALVTAPLEDIDRRLRYGSLASLDSASAMDDLMNFPRVITSRTRQSRGSFDSMLPPELNAGQHSPYSFQNLNIDSGPTTPAFPPSYNTFMGNISVEDLNLSVPPSPFLNSFASPASRRHSGFAEQAGSRPNSMNFDGRSFGGFSGFGPSDSPAYSPQAYSPVPSAYLDEDHHSLPGDRSGSWGAFAAGFPYDESADKNKDRALSWQGTPPHM
ncbi:MAG: hypothetical protein LQ340_001170 [Diploschistes diacapsis]|nr:MAG: hypothetical protein LQ340_001170 [Diploschistes diacapsis]